MGGLTISIPSVHFSPRVDGFVNHFTSQVRLKLSPVGILKLNGAARVVKPYFQRPISLAVSCAVSARRSTGRRAKDVWDNVL